MVVVAPTCSGIHEHTHTHTRKCTHPPCVYWTVSHFLLSEAFPPFSLCHPARPPSLPALIYLLLSLTTIADSVTLFYIFYSPFAISSLSFPSICHYQSVSYHVLFLLLLLFWWPSTGPPCWASGQFGSEAGCNYFTTRLTATVKEGRENKQEIMREIKENHSRLIIYSQYKD